MEAFWEWPWLKNAGCKGLNLGRRFHTSTPRLKSHSVSLIHFTNRTQRLKSQDFQAVRPFFSNVFFNDSIRSASWWPPPPSFRLRCRRRWTAAAALSWGWPLRVGSGCWPRMFLRNRTWNRDSDHSDLTKPNSWSLDTLKANPTGW